MAAIGRFLLLLFRPWSLWLHERMAGEWLGRTVLTLVALLLPFFHTLILSLGNGFCQVSAGLAQGDEQHDAVAESRPRPVAHHVPGIPYALEFQE